MEAYPGHMLYLFVKEGMQYGGVKMTRLDMIAAQAELTRRRVLLKLLT